IRLDDVRARDPELVGAKASALATASVAGLPVLPGIVVTTAFRAATPEHRSQLREAWSDISHAGEVSLVVRSSSTIEDTGTSSMAGMFTSVLDVAGWEQFEAAIETVLASSNVVALGDRREDGRPVSGPAPMAVLVQPYLVSTSGGVLFGLDPVSGRQDRLVVSATDKGPNALVSGEVDGIRYVLSRRGRLVEGPPTGASLLGRRQLRSMARVAAHAARVFGGPQDIEWAFDTAGNFRLLQSRPVTARGHADAAEGPVFGPGPVAETFPDPLLPLEEELWAGPLGDALRHALTLGSTAPRRRLAASPVLRSVGGRLAVDLELMPDAATTGSFLSRLDPRPPLRRLVAAWRVGRLGAALPLLAADLLARSDDDLLAIDDVEALSDDELLGILFNSRQGLVALHGHEVLMGWLVDAPTATLTAASMAMRFLADARSGGLADDEIVLRHPGVLALTPPRISAKVELPPVPETLPPTPAAPDDPADPGLLREALRLRARWLQELTARAAWELGRRLTAKGTVEHPHDVALLRLGELETAVRTGAAPADLPGRTMPISAPLPTRFRLTPNGEVVATAPARRGRRGRGGPAGAQGAGGGRGVGYVHEYEGQPLPQGAVLVVRTLDPGLASLLPRLGGLIAETGSPLSHLAILARELGVPTAVGVEGATTRFPSGSFVMVDGTTGEIQLLERGPAAGEPTSPIEQTQGGGAA
ncbi:MAG TPA: PEP/pyruvate-binding domain-containing protein, partial [Acidimicrobiales bacterium]|nr:PEP/pyruvate-binding domain-containing protein [Acidimicrobiales bacterium]